MSTPSEPTDQSRVVAGRYSLDAQIGRGGMGVVWRGEDRMLGRTVALKRVGMAPGADEGDLARAEREARLAARLNHPHIVAIFDLAAHDDAQWLVMEYVPGRTLGQAVAEDGPMDPEEARRVVSQAADALAAAHAAGILHRDVKPSNILLRSDGEAKLTDFGIARASGDATLTQTGLVTGSPAYLSPEVASGGRATAASDVWALGATLFHAVEGHPPYDMGGNVMAGLYQVVHGDVPQATNAGPLAVVLENTMVKDPEKRWPMDRVRDALADPRRLDEEARAVGAGAGQDTVATAVVPPATEPMTRPVARPVAPPPTSIAPAADAPPTRVTREERDDRRGSRRRGLLLAALAALLVLGAIVGLVLSLGGGDDPQAGGSDSSSSATDGGSDDASDSASASPSDGASASSDGSTPSAADMESFAADYVARAASDPRDSFTSLTPAFKRESGGFGGYNGFWGTIASAQVSNVRADPEALTVSYTVAYERNDGSTTSPEDVTLQLVENDGTFLISGEG